MVAWPKRRHAAAIGNIRCWPLREEDVGFPNDNLTIVIDESAVVEQYRRALRIPAVLVRAHPLETNRTADLLRDKSRFRRAVIGTIAAITTGAFEVDTPHIFGRDL
jgi:hypothetical protein